MIRYLVYLDKDWPVPMTVFVDYYIRGKYSKHLANGTIDDWHTGRFYMFPIDWDHDLCIRNRVVLEHKKHTSLERSGSS
uniref:Neur_chan_LBD domain-containing protein n=1 Tax=Steinernema glaseri TaxID=37863 RepID=A0A1I7Y5B6_9BILA